MTDILVPRAGWTLRDYQKPLWRASAVQRRNVCAAWHRRGGKDEVLLNALAVQAMRRPASYAYMFPENMHARRAMWQAVNPHTGKRRVLETFPREMLAADPNETEMRLNLVNGSAITFFGSDNFDRMVGASLAGIVSSEHALSHPSAYGFFSPMLRENGGFFWAISTPRGRNHFHGLLQHAQKSPEWFSEVLPVSATGALTAAQIDEARDEYVSLYGIDQGEALFSQEYEVSFNAAILGAFYARELAEIRASGRVVPVDPEPGYPVHTAWDLGMRDSTAIWWFQVVGSTVCVVDCYASHGQGIQHYADVIKGKPWMRGVDYVPHDARVKELGTGRSRVEVMLDMGLHPEVVPLMGKMDGIQAVRHTLPRCVFSDRCEEGLAALEQYRREWDDERKTFRDHEVHDWTSHYADAFRYLAQSWRKAPDVGEVREDIGIGMILQPPERKTNRIRL